MEEEGVLEFKPFELAMNILEHLQTLTWNMYAGNSDLLDPPTLLQH